MRSYPLVTVALFALLAITPCFALAQRVPQVPIYSAKFLCGFSAASFSKGNLPAEPPVKPGNYATSINIHNYNDFPVSICKKAVLAPSERCLTNPTATHCLPPLIGKFVTLPLHPDQAFEVDCTDIVNLLNPVLPAGTTLPPFIKGFLEIVVLPGFPAPQATAPLSVTGVYTAQGCGFSPHGECRTIGGLDENVEQLFSFMGPQPAACNPFAAR